MTKAKELGISQKSEFTDLIELFKQLNRSLIRQFDSWEQWAIHINNAASKVQFAKLEIQKQLLNIQIFKDNYLQV